MDGPEDAQGSGQGEAASFPNTVEFKKEELDTTLEHVPCSRKGVPVAVSKFVRSFAQCFRDFIWSFPLRYELASILRMACFVASVDEYGLPIRHVKSLLSNFFLLASNRALIPSPELLFALSTKMLACGCFTKAKRWRIHIFSHQSLNGLSLNCFSLSNIISH
nr:hypothetical protein [Tanacetum cinerariifolium]